MPAILKNMPNPNPPIPTPSWNTKNIYGFISFQFIQVDPGHWQYTLITNLNIKPITSIFGVN